MKTVEKMRVLTIGAEVVTFDFFAENGIQSTITLPIGSEQMVRKYLKHEIPTEAETEYAINYIEDELMSKKELKNQGEVLVYNDPDVHEILQKNGMEGNSISRKTIESIFTEYAYIVMGRPASLGITEFNALDFATLLLLREITHHLNFEEIKFSAE